MNKISRREVITGIVAGGAPVLSFSEKTSAEEIVPGAFKGNHQPQPLPFDAGKLKGISEKLIKSHWENNYVGSVKALNAVEKRLIRFKRKKIYPLLSTAI